MTEYPFDLGVYSRPVTTASETCQIWFDRGFNWLSGFNHEEAAACFKKAIAADADCAMAYWGIAYAIGPNYNKTFKHFDKIEMPQMLAEARTAIAAAQEKSAASSEVEQALIAALAERFPAAIAVEDMSPWNDAYGDAMRRVYQQFPNDLDVTALCADALMNRTAWLMWDVRKGVPNPAADTVECQSMLENAITDIRAKGGPCHAGLWHLYIHLMEMSPEPEKALRVADELRNLVPDAGHLAHMSTHIYVLCGEYQAVVEANHAGILADEKFLDYAGPMNIYTLYRVHNYHFKIYGAMFLGQYAPAMAAVKGLAETVPDAYLHLEYPRMANVTEGYLSIYVHAYIRFGRWLELLALSLPEDCEVYSMTSAMIHYGKAVALAVLGQIDAATAQQALFEAAVLKVSKHRYMHTVTCLEILEVGREMLAGELLYRKGAYDQAFAHLRQAVVLEDALPYDEPWGWMQPGRHALGALLLEQGHVTEAAAAYRADLGLDQTVIRSNQHPKNIWALRGLYECYQRLGEVTLAAGIKPALELAQARADHGIEVSCFCAGQPAENPS
jgi:tetratricopeptide (TPR) repeat protein